MSSLVINLFNPIAALLIILLLSLPSHNLQNNVLWSAADPATESSPYERRIEECFFKLYKKMLIDFGVRQHFEINDTGMPHASVTMFSKFTSTLPIASNGSALIDIGSSLVL